ncbi:hypothetical protein [Thalassobius sp. MITS945101]|uniref:hypothetical protein n=1 Tax=Thalassobius sp. MITS945101 TaxID=3096994 RepID=UPI00399AAEBD
MTRDFKQLADLTALKFQIESRAMAPICQQEQDLTAALTKLRQGAKAAPPSGLGAYQLQGFDAAWQHWAGVKAQRLNQALAQTRLQKERKREQLARSFGTQQVAAALLKTGR